MIISIIIPVYNVEQYIERCLDSVLNQTYRNIEVIIVDDCTPDRSMEKARQCIDKSPLSKDLQFIYLKHDHNRGLSAARNTGMDAATGEYIYFLDSDDEITPDCVERLSEPLKEELYDLVVGNIRTIGNDTLHDLLSLKLSDGEVLRKAAIQKTYHKQWNMMAQNKLYRTEFLRKEGLTFMEGLIHEDELWSLQIACTAHSLRAVANYTYLYYIRPGSITTSNTKLKQALASEIIVTEGYSFLKEHKTHSIPLYRFLSNFASFVLSRYLDDKSEFYRVYYLFREKARIPAFFRMRMNGWNYKLHIMSLHNYLPRKLGACLLYHFYHRKE